ncbi:hypothetical protein [Streptomyces sp. NPDC053427]|uniref:hypothetical protein n=1 Tax=Streptomyces sp. NPDC053427 TaxID=3365701 RepID=UPI0037D11D3B
MFTRRLLAAAVLAATLTTLTSCKGEDAPASASPEATAPSASSPAPAPSGTPTSSPSPSASPSKDLSADPEPSSDCTPRTLAKGHRMVQLTGAPAGGTVPAREAKFACDPNGGGYAGTGKAARLRLASGATAELSTGAVDHRTATLAQLTAHLTACLRHETVEQPLACSGDLYEITVNGSGDVTHLSELWHS